MSNLIKDNEYYKYRFGDSGPYEMIQGVYLKYIKVLKYSLGKGYAIDLPKHKIYGKKHLNFFMSFIKDIYLPNKWKTFPQPLPKDKFLEDYVDESVVAWIRNIDPDALTKHIIASSSFFKCEVFNNLYGIFIVNDYLKDKNMSEIKDMFGLSTDFTEDEIAKIRKQNRWVEEDDDDDILSKKEKEIKLKIKEFELEKELEKVTKKIPIVPFKPKSTSIVIGVDKDIAAAAAKKFN
jgi:hypothetical protein